LEKLQEENAEETDIKKMKEQVFETAQMLPICKTKIETAIEDLTTFMSENEENDPLKEGDDWKVAEQVLAEVTAFNETIGFDGN
jgi:hypothetical protein